MLLKTFTVRGGDFATGKKGFFHPLRAELSLPRKSGQMPNDLAGVNEICQTAAATREAIEKMGGEIRFGAIGTLFRVLSNLACNEGAFVISFRDEKVLLATADHETCASIIKLRPVPVQSLKLRLAAMG
jgi:hypothetical protein